MAGLVPHAGAMVLLDRVEAWDAETVQCRARSHLDPANPLRRAGRLAACCGIEYALQAAAVHGALLAGGVAQAAGYVAALRGFERFLALVPQGDAALRARAAMEELRTRLN